MARAVSFALTGIIIFATGCAGIQERRLNERVTNKKAPDFQLHDLTGAPVTLRSFRGRPVLLAFFAYGCPYCRAEAPHLSRIAKEYATKGLVVLAPNAWDEKKDVLRHYVETADLRQRVLLDASNVFEAYRGTSVPTVFFINRDGIVMDVDVGFDGGPAELEAKVKKLVASG